MAKSKYSPDEAELLHRLREILANAGGIPLSISGMRDQIPSRISTPDVLNMLDHLCALGEVLRHEVKGQRATYANLQAGRERAISAPPTRKIVTPAPAPLPKVVRATPPAQPAAARPPTNKELPQAQIDILRVISSTPMSGNQIADVIDMAQPKVSSHLRKMVAAGLVQSSGRGSKIKFSPTSEPQPPLQKQAEMLIEPALDLIRQILIRHQTAVLEEMRDALHKLRASPQ